MYVPSRTPIASAHACDSDCDRDRQMQIKINEEKFFGFREAGSCTPLSHHNLPKLGGGEGRGGRGSCVREFWFFMWKLVRGWDEDGGRGEMRRDEFLVSSLFLIEVDDTWA